MESQIHEIDFTVPQQQLSCIVRHYQEAVELQRDLPIWRQNGPLKISIFPANSLSLWDQNAYGFTIFCVEGQAQLRREAA